MRAIWFFVLGVALLSLGMWLLASPARAHDPYTGWQRNDGKGSCCNKQDCRPVEWRTGKAGIEIQISELAGKWVAAPNSSVLPFSSPDDRAHACYVLVGCTSSLGCRVNFYCVALPMRM